MDRGPIGTATRMCALSATLFNILFVAAIKKALAQFTSDDTTRTRTWHSLVRRRLGRGRGLKHRWTKYGE